MPNDSFTILDNLSKMLITPGLFRLILALVVVMHHSMGAFAFGSSAVYLFFTLSGYWISSLWESKYSRKENPVRIFLLSRWWRLVPVFFVVLLVHLVFSVWKPYHFAPNQIADLHDLWWWLRQVSIFGITGSNTVVIPSWSLAVEMQFYVAFAFFMHFVKLRAVLVGSMLLAAISMVYGVTCFSQGCEVINGNLGSYFCYFAFGICFYLGGKPVPKFLIYGCCVLFVCIMFVIGMNPAMRNLLSNYTEGRSASMQNFQNILFFLSTMLLVPLALSTLRSAGNSEKDRFFGNLAYPLYLFHFLPTSIYWHYRPEGIGGRLLWLLSCWAISLIGALIIYWIIDRPSEKARRASLKI